MRILPVITQLKAECAAELGTRVYPALSLEPIKALADTPAAYVYWVEEFGQAPQTIHTSQRRALRFVVQTVAQAAIASEPLEDARDAILTALIGWQIGPTYDPTVHIKGEIIEIEGDIVWCRDIFETAQYARSV